MEGVEWEPTSLTDASRTVDGFWRHQYLRCNHVGETAFEIHGCQFQPVRCPFIKQPHPRDLSGGQTQHDKVLFEIFTELGDPVDGTACKGFRCDHGCQAVDGPDAVCVGPTVGEFGHHWCYGRCVIAADHGKDATGCIGRRGKCR